MDALCLNKEMANALLEEYGSPLYVYSEEILRTRCREMMQLVPQVDFRPNYSAKANTNLALLRIVQSEGLSADAMSPGEMLLELEAGFPPEDILFVSNNVSVEEMKFAVDRGILVSIDSLCQLELFGQNFAGQKVALRVNPGVGAGHHQKVVTAGKSKFGIQLEQLPRARQIAAQYNLQVVGLNQHIGSLFLEGKEYLQAARVLFGCALQFPQLAFVDLGGGMGVPYHGEERLNLELLGEQLGSVIQEFFVQYGRKIRIKAEPGRYIVAECGQLLGRVHSVKENYGETYIGTDIGFNVLMRPVLYDSYHEIVFYSSGSEATVTVVGNICESGDILATGRRLPMPAPGDAVGVLNAGAYGWCMCSNYNSRLRPAEVLLCANGSHKLIRRRDTYEEILRQL